MSLASNRGISEESVMGSSQHAIQDETFECKCDQIENRRRSHLLTACMLTDSQADFCRHGTLQDVNASEAGLSAIGLVLPVDP